MATLAQCFPRSMMVEALEISPLLGPSWRTSPTSSENSCILGTSSGFRPWNSMRFDFFRVCSWILGKDGGAVLPNIVPNANGSQENPNQTAGAVFSKFSAELISSSWFQSCLKSGQKRPAWCVFVGRWPGGVKKICQLRRFYWSLTGKRSCK